MTRLSRKRREAQLFAAGSTLFAFGAALAQLPGGTAVITGISFFAGSILFTAAALTQWRLSGRPRFAGWNGAEASDWWSAAVQFAGTLCFNVSTFSALMSLSPAGERQDVWRPDVYGSAAFLISSLLAVHACSDRDRLWDPASRSWKATWLNLLGSVAFGVSAFAARIPAGAVDVANPTIEDAGTFAGAVCFLAAALLMEPPAREYRHD